MYTYKVVFWNKIFKKHKSNKELVHDMLSTLSPGDLVYITFKSPKQIGIISGQTLSLTRLNIKEAAARKINGNVVRVWKDYNIKSFILEISTYNSPDIPGVQRKITFLEDEIEKVKKYNE